ncbi:MAG: DUF4402 domain-containing protein [Sphingomonas sp.]|nr:DUF4402 domain-containing protein [Sphingomonas sp.]
MVKPGLYSALVAGAALLAVPAHAQNPRRAPRVEAATPLSFGKIAAGTLAGTVTVSPDGAQSCTGVRCLGGARAAQFTITGAKDYLVAITLSPATLSNGQGATMPASFVASSATMVLRPGNNKNPFTVGGTLRIAARQPEGSYAGTYMVTVDYL